MNPAMIYTYATCSQEQLAMIVQCLLRPQTQIFNYMRTIESKNPRHSVSTCHDSS